MECGRWLLGIDIQPHQLIAVALVRRRDGDQLRGWWHFPLRGEATSTRFPPISRRPYRHCVRAYRAACRCERRFPSSRLSAIRCRGLPRR
ncbi:Uncharacterised protein [Edwardsiella tarda]|nr:Uncharacterised protein [Edwardsiella tarda]